MEDQGAIHILHKNMSSVLQNICHSHRDACVSSPRSLGRNTEVSAEKGFLSPVSPSGNSREWRSLSSRPRSWLSTFLHQILLYVRLILLNANLNEALSLTSHEPKILQGTGCISRLGDSSGFPCSGVDWPPSDLPKPSRSHLINVNCLIFQQSIPQWGPLWHTWPFSQVVGAQFVMS